MPFEEFKSEPGAVVIGLRALADAIERGQVIYHGHDLGFTYRNLHIIEMSFYLKGNTEYDPRSQQGQDG